MLLSGFLTLALFSPSWCSQHRDDAVQLFRACGSLRRDGGLIDFAPKIKVLKGANVRKWVLLPEKEAAYLAACTEPLRTIATIIVDAGLRPNECFALRWEHIRIIDATRAVIVVPGTKTAAAARPVPMTPRVRGIIEARWLRTGKPTSGWLFPSKRSAVGHAVDNTVYEPHTNAVKKVGLNPREFVLYALRHTCLTRWGASGMDAWTLARLAGHSNIRQSMTYVHPSDSALHAAINHAVADGSDKTRDTAELTVSGADEKMLVSASS